MTTITLEVSDELAVRLAPMQERLPVLLSLALDLLPTHTPFTSTASEAAYPIFNEMIDFLASGPTPDQIVAFKISESTQIRLEALLEKNADEGLTDSEVTELDVFEQVNHILLLLKTRARTVSSLN